MKFLEKSLNFFFNLVYLTYMTFMENDDFDFELLPFGNKIASDSESFDF